MSRQAFLTAIQLGSIDIIIEFDPFKVGFVVPGFVIIISFYRRSRMIQVGMLTLLAMSTLYLVYGLAAILVSAPVSGVAISVALMLVALTAAIAVLVWMLSKGMGVKLFGGTQAHEPKQV